MVEKEIEIKGKNHFSARTVTEIVGEAGQFEAELEFIHAKQEANLKSVVSLMALELVPGEIALIKGEGEEAKKAVEKIMELIRDSLSLEED